MEEAFKVSQKTSRRRNDTSVQGTNDSSILSKISTCQFGYFEDEFLKYFGTKIIRRSPLVNRFLLFIFFMLIMSHRTFLKFQ